MNVTAPAAAAHTGYQPFIAAGEHLRTALNLADHIRTSVEQTSRLPGWPDESLSGAVAAARAAADMIEQNMLPSKFGTDPSLAVSLARAGAHQLSIMSFDSGWKQTGDPARDKAMLLHDLDLASSMLTEAASRIGYPVS